MHIRRIKTFDVILVISITFLLVSIGTYQKRTEGRISAKRQVSINYLPSGTFLRGMALGYDEALADFIWVRTIGYFGAHVKTDRDFTWLIHMLRLTTELDPMFESPYEFAGVILPSELNMVDEGMSFLEEGIKNIPKHNRRYWLQPFYLGYCYMIYKDDPLKSAQYFEIANKYPQSPPYLPLLVTRLYGRAGKPGVGIDIIQSVLEEKRMGIMQNNYIKKKLIVRKNQLIATEDIQMLTHAVSEYAAIYHQRPLQLKDLVDGLILPFVLVEPFGGSYFLSWSGNEVLSTNFQGEFHIHGQKRSPKIDVSSPSE